MQTPFTRESVVIATETHRATLGIDADAPDAVYRGRMNDFADEVVDSGGSCNRELFEMAFYPRSIDPSSRFYMGTASNIGRKSLVLADKLAFSDGEPMATIFKAKPIRIDPAQIGLVLPIGTTASPAVAYEIERIDDPNQSDEPEYHGFVRIEGLWTPECSKKTPALLNHSEHLVLGLTRPSTKIVARIAIDSFDNPADMGLVIGDNEVRRHLDIVSAPSIVAALETYENSVETLLAEARNLGYIIEPKE